MPTIWPTAHQCKLIGFCRGRDDKRRVIIHLSALKRLPAFCATNICLMTSRNFRRFLGLYHVVVGNETTGFGVASNFKLRLSLLNLHKRPFLGLSQLPWRPVPGRFHEKPICSRLSEPDFRQRERCPVDCGCSLEIVPAPTILSLSSSQFCLMFPLLVDSSQ